MWDPQVSLCKCGVKENNAAMLVELSKFGSGHFLGGTLFGNFRTMEENQATKSKKFISIAFTTYGVHSMNPDSVELLEHPNVLPGTIEWTDHVFNQPTSA